jgi:hypothetical protein
MLFFKDSFWIDGVTVIVIDYAGYPIRLERADSSLIVHMTHMTELESESTFSWSGDLEQGLGRFRSCLDLRDTFFTPPPCPYAAAFS